MRIPNSISCVGRDHVTSHFRCYEIYSLLASRDTNINNDDQAVKLAVYSASCGMSRFTPTTYIRRYCHLSSLTDGSGL